MTAPWIEALVGRVDMQCKVCSTEMVAHMYGWPLTVCPQCFPAEDLANDPIPDLGGPIPEATP